MGWVPNHKSALAALVGDRHRRRRQTRRQPPPSGLSFERLEARVVLDAGLVISELLASNDHGLQDYDDDRPDWIEVLNTRAAPVDLGGHYLTDDAENLAQWQFPPQTLLAGGEHLLVFASGKDFVAPDGQLHTNFKLARGGEYLALVEPDGQTVAWQFDPALAGGGFPSQFEDVSYGLAPTAEQVTLVAASADVSASDFLRTEFTLANPAALDELTLRVRYDDGFVAYVNGQEVARRNAPQDLAWDSAAAQRREDAAAVGYEEIPLTVGASLRDFHRVADATFVLDVPNGTYDVKLYQGGTKQARENMAVLLEGSEVAVVRTEAEQFAINQYRVAVADGQLTLRIASRGAAIRSVINALEVRSVDAAGAGWAFDFGTSSSPVRADRRRITETTRYSPALGYGWANGDIRAKDRLPAAAVSDLLTAGVNVLAIQGLNVSAGNPDMLLQAELVAVEQGVDPSRLRYFALPTPATPNDVGELAVATTPTISVPGGTFVEPFLLELATDLPNGVIHYTLDASLPTELSPVYDPTAPLAISTTTQVRAIVTAPDHVASPAASATYVKLANDLLDFTSAIPIVILDNIRGTPFPLFPFPKFEFAPAYWAIFEPQGAGGRSSLVGAPEFQTRAGGQMRGNSSSGFPRKSFRLEAWDELNRDKDVSPFGLPAAADWILNARSEFDQSLMNNAFMYALSNQSGLYATRTRFVELFINTDQGELTRADYLGVYTFVEKIKRGRDRVDVEKLAKNYDTEPLITGGYVLNLELEAQLGELFFSAGGRNSFQYVEPRAAEMVDPIRQPQVDYIKNYIDQVAASLDNPDPDTGYPALIDVDSWIDYHLLSTFSMNSDALDHSTYMTKARGGKLKHGPIWDYDRALGAGRTQTDRKTAEGWRQKDFTTTWWGTLFEDPDFRQRYVDRFQEFREGPWSEQNIGSIVDRLAAELTAEAADRTFERWPRLLLAGDPPSWRGEVAVLRKWVLDRVAWMADQFIPKPIIDLQTDAAATGADPLPTGSTVTLRLPAGAPAGAKIFYTLDGSDPRLSSYEAGTDDPAGVVAASAVESHGEAIALAGAATLRARTFLPDSDKKLLLDSQSIYWSGPAERSIAAAGPRLAVTELHYHPADPSAAELAIDPSLSASDFEFVELQNVGTRAIDLGGYRLSGAVRFTFPALQLEPGQYAVVAADVGAFRLRYPAVDQVLGSFSGKLGNGGEALTLGDAGGAVVVEFVYDDNDPWPRRADGAGASLELADPAGTPAEQYGKYYRWRGSTEFGGSPGRAGVDPAGVVINEIVSRGDPAGNVPDAIELANLTGQPVDIGGWYLSDSARNLLKYQIPAGTTIAAGGYVVFDETDFNSTPVNPGPNDFGLSGTEGDDVYLVQADGAGSVARFVDDVHFSAAAVGEPFGRMPAAAGRLAPLPAATLAAANGPPRIGPVLISEIQYRPAEPTAADPDVLTRGKLEFVELYNPTTVPVDLAHWQLAGSVQFQFAAGTRLGPREALLIVPFDPAAPANAALTAAFRDYWQLDPTVRVLGDYSGNLADSGAKVQLLRPDALGPADPSTAPRVLVDETIYDNLAPWPAAAAGLGESLTRVAANAYGPAAASWRAAAPTPGSADLVLAGDLDLDGDLDFDDITDMALALADADAYQTRHGVSALVGADLNEDGRIDWEDIDRFVALLKGR